MYLKIAGVLIQGEVRNHVGTLSEALCKYALTNESLVDAKGGHKEY